MSIDVLVHDAAASSRSVSLRTLVMLVIALLVAANLAIASTFAMIAMAVD